MTKCFRTVDGDVDKEGKWWERKVLLLLIVDASFARRSTGPLVSPTLAWSDRLQKLKTPALSAPSVAHRS
jgi:hypothetical protein